MQSVISFSHVSKRYIIGAGRGGLRGALAALPHAVMRHSMVAGSEFWALQNIDFAVQAGQSVGFLGHNGAGKTTILKLLSGITRPTRGSITVRGRVGTLIELGAGFHPEMTGRENVYLNGVILGMTRREVARQFDSIVAFADIGDFLDTPVKRYSSGMYVRLAFAVAAHIDPAVLLVDEVLAVGDIGFRAKCYRRMAELRKSGTTVILVSHDMYAIRDTCDRALLLKGGVVVADGVPDKVISAYQAQITDFSDGQLPSQGERLRLESSAVASHVEAKKAVISSVRLLDGSQESVSVIVSGETLHVEVSYEAFQSVVQPIFRVDFYHNGVLVTGASTEYDHISLAPLRGLGTFRLSFEHLFLPVGVYTISIVIAETFEYNLLDVRHQAYPLQVLRPDNSRGELNLPRIWHVEARGSDWIAG